MYVCMYLRRKLRKKKAKLTRASCALTTRLYLVSLIVIDPYMAVNFTPTLVILIDIIVLGNCTKGVVLLYCVCEF